MPDDKVVLVTGVAGYWGARVAARLVAEPGLRVIGVDETPPEGDGEAPDFVAADVRNPLFVELLKAEAVDVLCHLAFKSSIRRSESAFDRNVLGTMKLLGACADAGVDRVVLKSSMAVYGARPGNSAFLQEDHPLNGSRRYGYTRDWVEIERFCNGFRRQSPGTALTILRFPSIIGPTVKTPMTRFLSEASAPLLLGFDPMLQLIHEDDVVEALARAVLTDLPGAINVAAEDAMPLNKIRGQAGKLPFLVFHPIAYWGAGMLSAMGPGLGDFAPIELDYLRYPWVGDLTRMRDELGFETQYMAEDALREFGELQRTRGFLSEAGPVGRGEQWMRDLIRQRRQAREGAAPAAPTRQEGVEND